MNITVRFEEMPAVILDGCDAGLLDGTCEVEYDREHLWSIEAISIEVYRPSHFQYNGFAPATVVPGKFVLVPLCPNEHPNIYGHLVDVIEDRLSGYITNQIELDEDLRREEAAEARAEARREERILERHR